MEALKQNGAKIIGTVEMTVPVKAFTPDEMTGKYDVILLMTKQLHNAEVVAMLQDIRHGKPCEVDAINGVVCDWGKKCGVPTPINDRIAEVIRKQQDGQLPLSPGNIRLFDDLL